MTSAKFTIAVFTVFFIFSCGHSNVQKESQVIILKPFNVENDSSLSLLKSLINKSPKTEVLSENADSLYNAASELVVHIDKIKAKMFSMHLYSDSVGISKQVYSNGKFLIGLDSVRTLAGIDNYEVGSRLMIGNPQNPNKANHADGNNYTAVVLRNKLDSFRELFVKNSTFSESGKDLAKSVSTTFYFKTKEEVQGQEEEWTVRNFHHVPIAAITAILTTLQAQVMIHTRDFIDASLEEAEKDSVIIKQ